MPTPRDTASLPQLGDRVLLTDTGLETDLIFHHGVDLPEFAAFPLLDDEHGRGLLRHYYTAHAELAVRSGAGFVLETPTWRANADWGRRVGYDASALAAVNRSAVDLVVGVRDELADGSHPMPVSGCLGPRGDAYRPEALMSADEAAGYHRPQVAALAETAADLVTAMTLTYAAEAVGVAQAAEAVGLPVALSFTVETDGRLPDGTALAAAVTEVDEATGGYPAYFMVNCAHPQHFAGVLDPNAAWAQRIRAVRANASTSSHAELDEATELDDGDPVAFGHETAALRERLPWLTVLGGCCGTDLRHLEQVAAACL